MKELITKYLERIGMKKIGGVDLYMCFESFAKDLGVEGESTMDVNLSKLEAMEKIQSEDGNWNASAYQHGFHSGLIMAIHTMKGLGGTPVYYDAPDYYQDEVVGEDSEAEDEVGVSDDVTVEEKTEE